MSFTSALLIRVEKAEDVLEDYFKKINKKGRRGEKAGRGPVQRGLTIRARGGGWSSLRIFHPLSTLMD